MTEETSQNNNSSKTINKIPVNKKLGSGLSALLGERKGNLNNSFLSQQDSKNLSSNPIENIPVAKIIAGFYQPRKNFNEEEIIDLANSIKEHGILQPLILRRVEDGKHYEIIAGERRFRASKLLSLEYVPSIVKKINNHQALELAIIENVQRSDLSPIEEAEGYKQLLEEFSYTQEHLSKKIGKSRAYITNTMRLLNLPQIARELLDKKLISTSHARALLAAESPDELANKIVANKMSVQDVENEVRDQKIIAKNKINNDAIVNASGDKPAFIYTTEGTKFISSQYLEQISKDIADLTECEVKINYNNNKQKGKIVIDFDDIFHIKNLISKINHLYQQQNEEQ
jgi:ParB family chromosome partitioning protein